MAKWKTASLCACIVLDLCTENALSRPRFRKTTQRIESSSTETQQWSIGQQLVWQGLFRERWGNALGHDMEAQRWQKGRLCKQIGWKDTGNEQTAFFFLNGQDYCWLITHQKGVCRHRKIDTIVISVTNRIHVSTSTTTTKEKLTCPSTVPSRNGTVMNASASMRCIPPYHVYSL